MKISARNLTIGLFLFFLCGCLEKEKGVSLGSSVMEKKITMTSSLVDGLKVDIYLISDEAVEGELLAKAMNSSGQEIGRSKQTLALQTDSDGFDGPVPCVAITRGGGLIAGHDDGVGK